jgi:hypothetical protein
MRTDLVVVFHVRQQYVTEMPLAEHNNMVKALPSDRTDESLCKYPLHRLTGKIFQGTGNYLTVTGKFRALFLVSSLRAQNPRAKLRLALLSSVEDGSAITMLCHP